MHKQSMLKAAIAQGLHAARRNLVPGIIIWCVAAAVLLAWHYWPMANHLLTQLSDFKQEWSYPFAFISTGIAGGLLPAIILWLVTRKRVYMGRQLPWLCLFWALKGLEVNALYSVQASLFGSGDDPGTLTIKVLIDQFIYVPIWASPSTILGYVWIERGWKGIKDDWKPGWYARSVLPLLLANMAVWVPAVTIIYALETPLQLPIQNLVLCFWSLMVAMMALNQEQTASTV